MEDRPAGALTKGTPQPPESATVPVAEENLVRFWSAGILEEISQIV